MAGHGSLAGLMPFSDANQIVVEMVTNIQIVKYDIHKHRDNPVGYDTNTIYFLKRAMKSSQ